MSDNDKFYAAENDLAWPQNKLPFTEAEEILSLEDRIDERPIVEIENQYNDYWFEQRYADAKFAEQQKAERSRQWREEATIHAYPFSKTEPMTGEQIAEAYLEDHPSARSKATPPKPSQVHFKPSPEKIKEMAEAFKPIATKLKKAGKAAEKAAEAFKYAFPEHLTERPFHTPELIALRESLAKNQ